MHFQNSRTESGEPYVLVGEPWEAADGVHGPDIQVWPLGPGSGLLLTFSLDEAQTLIEKVLSGIEEARALFPEPPG